MREPLALPLGRAAGPQRPEASTLAASSQRYPDSLTEPLPALGTDASEVNDDSPQHLLSSYCLPDCDEQDACIIALSPLRLSPLISLFYTPQ